MRILTIAPDDARSLYLRLSDGNADALGISHDAGDTLHVALQLTASMSAFLLRSDGALIVAAADASSFISTDAGKSFVPWSSPFHVRALAERDGAIYASANGRLDHFSLAVSRDAGASWQPLLRLKELRGPLQCGEIPQLCADSWKQLAPALPAFSGDEVDAGIEPLPAAESSKSALKVRGGGCSIAMLARVDSDHREPCFAVCLAWIACVLRRRSRSQRASS
jgi:hypothetical protein